MNTTIKLIAIACFLLLQFDSVGQCIDVEIADPSFEDGTFADGNPWMETGYWYRNDGAEVSGNYSFEGDSSLCSNAGGAQQYIQVDPNTTYYLNCYVANGMDDPWVRYIINEEYQPILTIPSNDWTLISHSFNSMSDTIINIGVYSSAACFDQFSLTCDPIVSTEWHQEPKSPISIYPTQSSEDFTLKMSIPGEVRIFDIRGNLIKFIPEQHESIRFGADLQPSSIYIIQFRSGGSIWIQKVIKI